MGKHVGGSIMPREEISSKGTRSIFRADEKMEGTKYRRILEENLSKAAKD